MSALDVYSLAHKDERESFLEVVEKGLKLDRKDFAPNGYPVDETQFPINPTKLELKPSQPALDAALAGPSHASVAIEVGEEENEGSPDAVIDISDSIPLIPGAGDDSDTEETLRGEEITSPKIDKVALAEKRKNIVPQRLFTDENKGQQSGHRVATSADSGGPSTSASKGKALTLEDVNMLVNEKVSEIVSEKVSIIALKMQESQERAEKRMLEVQERADQRQNNFMEYQNSLMAKQQEGLSKVENTFAKFLDFYMSSNALPIASVDPQLMLTSGQTPTSSAAQIAQPQTAASPSVAHDASSTQTPQAAAEMPTASEADTSKDEPASEAG